MKTLQDYRYLLGQTVEAENVNYYGQQVIGKCINVRECIDDYTDITKGIRHLIDVEQPDGSVCVCLAKSAKLRHTGTETLDILKN